jgi:hypothetical protein
VTMCLACLEYWTTTPFLVLLVVCIEWF